MSTGVNAFDDTPLLGLRAIIGTLLAAHGWPMWSVVIAGALAFGVVAFAMKPVYRGTVVLAPNLMQGVRGLGAALGELDGKFRSINQDGRTGLITVTVDWTSSVDAAAWTNEMAQRLNPEMRARAIANADASVSFLKKELLKTSTSATRDAISRLVESPVKQRMLVNVTEGNAFRIVDKVLPSTMTTSSSPDVSA